MEALPLDDAASAGVTTHPAKMAKLSPLVQESDGSVNFAVNFGAARFEKTAGWPGRVMLADVQTRHGIMKGILGHPTSGLVFESVKIYPQTALKFTPYISIAHQDKTDGVVFMVLVMPQGENIVKVFERELVPQDNADDREPGEESISLAQFAGKVVDIQFITDNRAGKNNSYDMAYWVNPRLAVR